MSAPAVRQGDRSRRALAVGLAAVAVLELVLTVLLDRGAADLPGVLQDPYAPAGALVGAGFVAGGLLLCLAKPRNPVGWLLLAFTAFGTLTDLASVYALRAFALDLPLKTLAASVGGSIWLVSLYLLVPLLLLLYPTAGCPRRGGGGCASSAPSGRRCSWSPRPPRRRTTTSRPTGARS